MGSIDKACISGFLCRLCSEMHRIVIHIYGDQGQRLCLVEKINGYLPITISPTDPLPKTICETCLRRVEQHYDLLMRLSRTSKKNFGLDKSQRMAVNRECLSSPDSSHIGLQINDDNMATRRVTNFGTRASRFIRAPRSPLAISSVPYSLQARPSSTRISNIHHNCNHSSSSSSSSSSSNSSSSSSTSAVNRSDSVTSTSGIDGGESTD